MKYENIQIGRGVAALVVAFHHLLLPQLQMVFPHSILFQVLHFNYMGDFAVYFFFCISGFVMILSCTERPKSAKDFIFDRIIRIYPLYITFTLISLITFRYTRGDWSWLINLNYYPKDIGEIISSLTLFPPLTNSERFAMPLASAWSLVYEMFFYILFAFLLFFFKIKYLPHVLLIIFISLFLIINLAFEPVRGRWVHWPYVISDLINLCFAIGGLLYFAPKWIPNKKWVPGILITVMLLVLMLLPEFYHSKITLMVFAILVFYLVLSLTYTDNSLGRILCYLGNASYSIYLTHIVSTH
ncbi:acyltransferase family protein [Cronobacter malonaticus]|uniref:acyltransferase family protein n=1 Tax=Cronobacter malonaticus TaxID=413503 RepID=UPI0029CA5D20|nr:acyltransferase [Cronobacter malonaticus]